MGKPQPIKSRAKRAPGRIAEASATQNGKAAMVRYQRALKDIHAAQRAGEKKTGATRLK